MVKVGVVVPHAPLRRKHHLCSREGRVHVAHNTSGVAGHAAEPQHAHGLNEAQALPQPAAARARKGSKGRARHVEAILVALRGVAVGLVCREHGVAAGKGEPQLAHCHVALQDALLGDCCRGATQAPVLQAPRGAQARDCAEAGANASGVEDERLQGAAGDPAGHAALQQHLAHVLLHAGTERQ